MKLPDEKIAQLKELCFEGKSNKDIAEIMGISISDVYAKRSQLGITIDKVKAAKGKGLVEKPYFKNLGATLEDNNKKVRFVKMLLPVLQMADKKIVNLILSDNGYFVVIVFLGDTQRLVNIECDSFLAIVADVVRALL